MFVPTYEFNANFLLWYYLLHILKLYNISISITNFFTSTYYKIQKKKNHYNISIMEVTV